MCIWPLNMIQCLSEECTECMNNVSLLSFKVCAWGKFLEDYRWMSLLRNCCLCSQLCNFQADILSTRRRNKCVVLNPELFFVFLYNNNNYFFTFPFSFFFQLEMNISHQCGNPRVQMWLPRFPIRSLMSTTLSRTHIFFNNANKIDSWNISSNCIASHFCV